MNKYWLLMNHLQQKNPGEDFSNRPEWQEALAEVEVSQGVSWGERVVQGLTRLFAPHLGTESDEILLWLIGQRDRTPFFRAGGW